MKNRLKIVGYFLITCMLTLSLASCRSHKELMYLRDVNGNSTLASLSQSVPVYKIQPKDNLYVSIISSNPELTAAYNPAQAGESGSAVNNRFENQAEQYINGFQVDADGKIKLPIIGNVDVGGLTVPDAQEVVAKQAGKFVKDVIVKIKLLNFRVSVLGEVKLPGVYYNYNDNFSVLNAIASASGNTDYANLASVLVLRPKDGGSETFVLNLNSKQALASPGFYLQPNDVVVLQPAGNKNTQLSISTTALVLSAITSVFLILNYVKN